jgi:hypothetical protein
VSAATRSGLLFGIFAFFSNLGLGILLAFCTPLCGIVWGIGAGIAAVAWSDESRGPVSPARDGAIAGAIAGIGALLGVVIGMFVLFALLGGQQAATQAADDLYDQFGLDMPMAEINSSLQWFSVSVVACCLGLLNVAILAGAGALSATIYGSGRAENPASDGA